MKIQSASFSMYTMDAGHHREACIWHDADHKAEVIGTVPDIFISQRWVTPPDWVKLLPQSSAEQLGEYVNLYWSSADAAVLSDQFRELGQRMGAVGRMDMLKYMHKTWPAAAQVSMRPVSMQSRPGFILSPEAVLASTAMTGLVTTILESKSGARDHDFDRWQDEEHIPAVLASGLFAGAVRLVSDHPELPGTSVVLYYTDDEDPASIYTGFRELSEQQANGGGTSAERLAKVETVFESVSCPSIGHYDYYD